MWYINGLVTTVVPTWNSVENSPPGAISLQGISNEFDKDIEFSAAWLC